MRYHASVIPVYEPLIGDEEVEAVAACVRSGWIGQGHRVAEFERLWASYCGRKFGIATSSGTTALEAAISVLDLRPKDEVILPTFTMIACVMAVIRSGATPVLVDSDPRTWCMDPEEVEARITPRTRVIMPVHIYGHPVDMDPILDTARRYGLVVIEDVAEAHGAEYLIHRKTPEASWKRCGSFGMASTFSFYSNKILATGEGGMILVDDLALAERLRSVRNMCFGKDRRFCHEGLGFNFRMTDVQGSLGIAQTGKIGRILEAKRRLAERYRAHLSDFGELIQLPTEESWARNVFWMYGVVLSEKAGVEAYELSKKLFDRGVETRPFFLGMHEQPALQKRGLFRDQKYPISERLSRQGLYLPSGPTLKDNEVDAVCRSVLESLSV